MNRFALVFGLAGVVAGILGVSALTGCTTPPTADVVYLAGRGCGSTTGIVLDNAVKDPEVRKRIVEIAGPVSQVIPQVGQTLDEAWGDVAKEHTAKLVAQDKLTEAQGRMVVAGFKLVCVGWSALEDRYPSIRVSRDLANAGLSGFFDGFLATFKADECEDCCDDCTIDRHTYMKLKAVRR